MTYLLFRPVCRGFFIGINMNNKQYVALLSWLEMEIIRLKTLSPDSPPKQSILTHPLKAGFFIPKGNKK